MFNKTFLEAAAALILFIGVALTWFAFTILNHPLLMAIIFGVFWAIIAFVIMAFMMYIYAWIVKNRR